MLALAYRNGVDQSNQAAILLPLRMIFRKGVVPGSFSLIFQGISMRFSRSHLS
jgi:hypothetical protein